MSYFILFPTHRKKNLILSLFLSCFFRLIKEFDREVKDNENKNTPDIAKILSEKKQWMVLLSALEMTL